MGGHGALPLGNNLSHLRAFQSIAQAGERRKGVGHSLALGSVAVRAVCEVQLLAFPVHCSNNATGVPLRPFDCGFVHRIDFQDKGHLIGGGVQNLSFRIVGRSAPTEAPPGAGHGERAPLTGRSKKALVAVFGKLPPGVGLRLGRDVSKPVFVQSLLHDHQVRLHRLGRVRLLAGHVRSGHRGFLIIGQGLTRLPVQHDEGAHFGGLHQHVYRLPPVRNRHQGGSAGQVVVPQVVVHRLVVPLTAAGRGVEGNHAVAEQVFTVAVGSVEVVGGRAGSHVDHSPGLVQAESAPAVGSAVVLPGLPLPGVVTEGTRLRQRAEDPLQRPTAHVVGADVSR